VSPLHRLYSRVIDVEQKSLGIQAIRWGLRPISYLYGAIISARRRAYHQGLFRSERVSCCVVSIGNLTVGGTGKTPITLALARELIKRGFRIAVISRGYKRTHVSEKISIVSDGKRILTDVAHAGDEPLMIARQEPRAIVAVGANRVQVARLIIRKYTPDAILLDDGFSHLAIARDFDLLLLHADAPTGNGQFLPLGPLREAQSALSDADLICFTRCRSSQIEPMSFHIPTIRSGYRVIGFRRLDSTDITPVHRFPHKKATAASGIANPNDFARILKSCGIQLNRHHIFPDHHPYFKAEARRIATSSRLPVIVTEKDAVKWESLINQEQKKSVWATVMESYIMEPVQEWERFLDRIGEKIREKKSVISGKFQDHGV